ncbi:unnamed protein product [Orchesella dallaii]|uniref:2-epi-5-epi-valiolone synthase n=1 Tax=Orchesella dallaii TaxID=48710 RepID=A0ABP1QG89_9HEXA
MQLNDGAHDSHLYSLEKKDDTWVSVPVSHEDKESIPREKFIIETFGSPTKRWKAKSTIEFEYTVDKVNGLLSSLSPLLLITPEDYSAKEIANRFNDSSVSGFHSLNKNERRIAFVDETVYKLYSTQISNYFDRFNVQATIHPVITTEETKSVETLKHVLKLIDQFKPERRSEPIIGIGGGVCLDIVGLAATLYRRRTPYIRVPTTLLALVDASVGAKTGVNFCNGKNKLGAYVPPFAVFLDQSFLKTLPKRHLSNGMAEILKMALVKDLKLFELLEEFGQSLIDTKFQGNQAVGDEVLTKAIDTMLEELVPNLWEDDLDRLVDYGHVISPQLEMEVLPALLHGEAVCIDMAFMCFLSHEMGYLDGHEVMRVIKCMRKLDIPVYHAN